MRWIPASLLLASMAAVATVPFSFPAGVPAKATQVNRNFEVLDSLVTSQIEQLSDLRDVLVSRVDALRKDLDSLQARPAQATLAGAAAPDTSWKSSVLPIGAVLGLTTAPGPDGFLPGSLQTWQSVEAFGGIRGLPSLSAVEPLVAAVAPIRDTVSLPVDSLQAVATAPHDSLQPASTPVAPVVDSAAATPSPIVAPAIPAPIATAAKPVFRWYVKVK